MRPTSPASDQRRRSALRSSFAARGSEAFSGSAILTRWLSSRNDRPSDIRVVFVHAINPWAFSYRTRTDENNVDINRNFLGADPGPTPENPAYDAAVYLLHADPSDAAGVLALHRAYRAHFEANGWAQEGQIWQGQWHRPDGFMYGGQAPSWSNVTFRRIVREHLSRATTIGSSTGTRGSASSARSCT
ncbi:DUF2817 domain-containing protein [Mesorhizobium sp. M4B.F.Ca.ET.214.01.1.1]|nr:DUF2817 domain-containing protein [Mesorhizobium sp. M4B.F.Ca.ET.214.01.1.1]TGQ57157.1 DUF2817 domain-containing protein [Mesorhizobium sp. M4B.F.Ca.ET.211.01.1.1]TGU30457.1 DUF2817 domain-containing protein [Mesorhizobium sp. M4B.F.Ca.ET.150.01.1.1]